MRACEAPILSQFGFARSRKLDFLDRWIGFAVTAHGWGWKRVSSSALKTEAGFSFNRLVWSQPRARWCGFEDSKRSDRGSPPSCFICIFVECAHKGECSLRWFRANCDWWTGGGGVHIRSSVIVFVNLYL